MISAYVLEIHCFEFAHDLSEVGPAVGVVIPAALHQVQEGSWCISFRDLWSESLLDDALTDDLSIDAVVWWFARRQLPHDDAEAEDIGLLSVLEAFDHLGGHPLVGADLRGHDLRLDTRPAEVSQLRRQGVIE